MKIAGMLKNSFVDYPGKVSAVVFTQGCNLRCDFCHNKALIPSANEEGIDQSEVLRYLDKRKGLLDAVVVSGGEPTLQHGLMRFLQAVRRRGFLIKLDTNGLRPDVLRRLLQEHMLDCVAMDVKAPLGKYQQIAGALLDLNALCESRDILMSSGIQYEFRTTFAPELDSYDLLEIAEFIKGCKNFALQAYREVDRETGDLARQQKSRTVPRSVMEALKGCTENLILRGEFIIE